MTKGWLLALVLAIAGISPVKAEAQRWSVGLMAGGAVHEGISRDVGTRSAILGVRYLGAPSFYLAAGAPLDSAGLPWAALGASERLTTGGSLFAGIDLAGHAHGYRDRTVGQDGGGVTLEALPFVGLARGIARVEAHAGVRSYGLFYGGSTLGRSVVDGGARVIVQPDATLSLFGESRWVRAPEDDFPYAGAGVELAMGRATAFAYAGRWISDAIPTAAWGLGGNLEVGSGFQLHLNVQQEASDPLYWQQPRRLWNVGVNRVLGRSAALPAAPVLPAPTDGKVILRVPVREAAEAPSVAGDFNEWKPVPMRRAGEHWEVSLPIAPGVYHYAFRRKDGSWFVPASVTERVDDGFGGENAVLIVASPAGS